MLKKVIYWLECSRWYTLPMSVFSWLIVFIFGLGNDGNVLYGLIALAGICFAHLATNLFDDYCDFNKLEKLVYDDKITLPNTQRGKCRYITEDNVRLKDILFAVGIYCFFAFLIGMFFYFAVGKSVLVFMFIGALIVLGYSAYSQVRLSEAAVGIAFGPLLFLGTYYVMTGKISSDVVILSLPSMLFTMNLLYTDTFMDKDIDKKEGKRTLVNWFRDNHEALLFQKYLLGTAYLSVVLLPIFDITDWEVVFIGLTLPYAIDLINSIEKYIYDKEFVPIKKWYHFPFEAWNDVKQNRSQIFMFRMYQARNLMIYVSLILSSVLLITY